MAQPQKSRIDGDIFLARSGRPAGPPVRQRSADLSFFTMLLLILTMSLRALAGDLIVTLPNNLKPATATATAGADISSDGEVKSQTVTFHKLLDGTSYDVKIVLDNGTVLQGVDMSWYNQDVAKAGAAKFSDDDRKEIQAIMDVKSFYNKSDILQLNGDHDRATVLMQLIRDTPFHSDKGGEVVWRIELWYFKNEYGGWAKIVQQNKILRRERFASHEEYEKVINSLKWMPALGGITVSKDKATTVVVPQPETPATQPVEEEEPER